MAAYVYLSGFAETEEEFNAASAATAASGASATTATLTQAGVTPEAAAQVAPVLDRALPAVDSFVRSTSQGKSFDFAKVLGMLGQKQEAQVNYFGPRKPSMVPVVLGIGGLALVTLAVLAVRSK